MERRFSASVAGRPEGMLAQEALGGEPGAGTVGQQICCHGPRSRGAQGEKSQALRTDCWTERGDRIERVKKGSERDSPLNGQAILIGNEFAVLDRAAHDTEVHGPTVARDVPVIVLDRPPGVAEMRRGCSVVLFSVGVHHSSSPSGVLMASKTFRRGRCRASGFLAGTCGQKVASR